jgi:hypothetical protein
MSEIVPEFPRRYDPDVLNLFIEHDARTLAELTGLPTAPACDAIILKHGDPSTVLASCHAGNPLGECGEHLLLDVSAPGDRIVTWSGTPASELFAIEPRAWMRAGFQALMRFCDDLQPQLQAHGRRLCFHPHSRHALNDVPSCLAFLNERGPDAPFEIALAPASMLEPGMLADVEDHLQRQFEALAARCAMVLLSDVRVGQDHCARAPLGEGLLPRELVLRLLREHVPQATPVVISGCNIDRQRQWLGL